MKKNPNDQLRTVKTIIPFYMLAEEFKKRELYPISISIMDNQTGSTYYASNEHELEYLLDFSFIHNANVVFVWCDRGLNSVDCKKTGEFELRAKYFPDIKDYKLISKEHLSELVDCFQSQEKHKIRSLVQ